MSEGGAFLAGSIIGKLLLDKTGWNSSIKDVGKDKGTLGSLCGQMGSSVSTMGKTFAVAGTAVVGALFGMAKTTADAAEGFLIMSKKSGASVESLSALAYAAKVTDSDIQDIGKAFTKMSMNMDDMVAGTGKSGTAMGALGLSVKDASGNLKPMDAILLDVAEKFSTMPDGPTKSAYAIDLFGKSGTNLIPFLNEGKEKIGALTEEAAKFGLVMSTEAAEAADNFGDQLEALKLGAKGVGQQIGMAVIPALTDFVLKAKDVVMTITEWLKAHPELTRAITGSALAIGGILMVVGPLMIGVGKLITSFGLLKGALSGITLAGAAGTAGMAILVGLVAKYAGILSETNRAMEYEIEASARLSDAQGNLADKLIKAGQAAGMQYGEMSKLIEKYGGNVAALAMAIKHGKEGITVQEALAKTGKDHADALEKERKAQEDAATAQQNKTKAMEDAKVAADAYTSFMNTLGIYTEKQYKDELILVERAERDLIAAHDAGKLSGEKFAAGIATLTGEADKYGIKLKTQILPANRDIEIDFKKMPSTLSSATFGFSTLDGAIEDCANKMMVSKATVQMMAYELTRLQLAAVGIVLPDMRFPDDAVPKMSSDVDSFKNLWDGFFNDVSSKWGTTINDFIGGNTSIETAWNRLWKNCGQTITDFVGKYITEKLVGAIQGIVSPAKTATEAAGKSFETMGSTVGSVASGIGGAITSFASTIGTVITTLASAIGTAIATIATGIATALVTLATGIATAATTLAAAAPALLVVGAVAVAIYAGFSAIGALLGAGGGGNSDITDWCLRIFENFMDKYDDMISMQNQTLDATVNILPKIDNLAGCVNSAKDAIVAAIGKVVDCFAALPGAAEGMVVREPSLVRVGEKGPGQPEIIAPLSSFISMADSSKKNAGSSLVFAPVFNVDAVDGNSVRVIVREKIGPELFAMLRANMGKTELREALGI